MKTEKITEDNNTVEEKGFTPNKNFFQLVGFFLTGKDRGSLALVNKSAHRAVTELRTQDKNILKLQEGSDFWAIASNLVAVEKIAFDTYERTDIKVDRTSMTKLVTSSTKFTLFESLETAKEYRKIKFEDTDWCVAPRQQFLIVKVKLKSDVLIKKYEPKKDSPLNALQPEAQSLPLPLCICDKALLVFDGKDILDIIVEENKENKENKEYKCICF